MQLRQINELEKIWGTFSKNASVEELQFDLELHRKLLNFFQAGDFYYYIFNVKTMQFDFLSSDVERMLGYTASNIDVPFFLSRFHPDDLIWYANYENEVAKFLAALPPDKIPKYKVRMDFRMKNKENEYIRILHQVMVIQQYQDGGILRTLGMHTDITHLKSSGKSMLSFIGMDGEPSYIDVTPDKLLLPVKEPLTKREKEILLLIIEGKQNKEISAILNISKQTVDRHRKNMIHNNNLKNSGELIAVAVKNGWI